MRGVFNREPITFRTELAASLLAAGLVLAPTLIFTFPIFLLDGGGVIGALLVSLAA